MVRVLRVQLAFTSRWGDCTEAMGPTARLGRVTLLPILHEVLLATLGRVEALCRHKPRAAAVGLRAGVPTAIILHLMQCTPPPTHTAPVVRCTTASSSIGRFSQNCTQFCRISCWDC